MTQNKLLLKQSLNFLFTGKAGQGLQVIEDILKETIMENGTYLLTSKEYMSRVRGGSNATLFRISNTPCQGFSENIDFMLALSQESVDYFSHLLKKTTVLITDTQIEENPYKGKHLRLPFSEAAKDSGGIITQNTVVSGFLLGLLNLNPETSIKMLTDTFSRKGEGVVKNNIDALNSGIEMGKKHSLEHNIHIDGGHYIPSDYSIPSGSEAIANGALHAGCHFLCSYPMSPGTGVMNAFAEYSDTKNVAVEQVEDEIAALNMAMGVFYGGGRALVTTSGGGFALMAEALSLSGMSETPCVVHIAQRPGPATGLPTRTEQSDLNFALHAGHGEFPRVILAPGNLQQGYEIGFKAFELADEFQIPVIILTDQYFVDTSYPVKDVNFSNPVAHIVKTQKDYNRYALTDNGVSPRGIPGNGEGFVIVTGNEHTEDGHITEDRTIRVAMQDKRMSKIQSILKNIDPPELIGPDNFKHLIICWGSTRETVKEALESLNLNNTALLHFSTLFPLHKDAPSLISKATHTIMIENNQTGQFTNLLKVFGDISINDTILKYDGRPFTVEDTARQIKRRLERLS